MLSALHLVPIQFQSSRRQRMNKTSKVLIATECFPPDDSTTAIYMASIAQALAHDSKVLVLSASPGSANRSSPALEVIELPNRAVEKGALARRMISAVSVAASMFLSVFTRATSRDVVFCVTTPFTLPYFVVLAAKLRGSAAVILIYDLYPDALVAARLIKPRSLLARLIRTANRFVFRAADAIITVGRDVPPLVLKQAAVAKQRLHFIPNWPLLSSGHRPIEPANRFRRDHGTKFIVGLSGNLGFTHSPQTVFEAARLLKQENDIHFLLSGWGVGWNELVALQKIERLENVTLIERVPEAELIDFLTAADLWIIPYRRDTLGVSIPSRLYNLLAVGRPIIISAESQSEAALVIRDNQLGWNVPPEDPLQLTEAIREAARDRHETADKGRRAAALATQYAEGPALARYREVLLEVRKSRRAP